MSFTVTGGAKWKPQLVEFLGTLRLGYRCPSCHRDYEMNVQAGGWVAPVVPANEDATGERKTSNETTPEVSRWEERRATGKVEHEILTELPFQLWCSPCQQGQKVTLVQVDADVERLRQELFPA